MTIANSTVACPRPSAIGSPPPDINAAEHHIRPTRTGGGQSAPGWPGAPRWADNRPMGRRTHFAVWHVLARPVPPRRIDLARRTLLRQGATLAVAAAGYSATEAAVRLVRLPGGERRFTGSYEFGSFQPELMPVSSWMFDQVPAPAPAGWRLRVVGPGGLREWTYEELAAFDDRLRAVLDCTGGFWSEQDWSGVLLGRLLPHAGGARSVRVAS